MFNPKDGAEKFTFQAEVNRLMDIIIHSLYSNKVRLLSARVTPPCDSKQGCQSWGHVRLSRHTQDFCKYAPCVQ